MWHIISDARIPALQQAVCSCPRNTAKISVHYASYRNLVVPLNTILKTLTSGDTVVLCVPFVASEELQSALSPLKEIAKKATLTWYYPSDAKEIAELGKQIPQGAFLKNEFYTKQFNESDPVIQFINYRLAQIFMFYRLGDQVLQGIIETLLKDPKKPQVSDKEAKRIKRFATEQPSIAGSSPTIDAIKKRIVQIANTDLSVLIRGETGTGKEATAFFLHEFSARRDAPFVQLNCAGLEDNLLESELFGHSKGAFTGADKARDGLIQAAKGGTLFLDELPEISPRVQAKLLRFLQSGQYRRLGTNNNEEADVRIIAAGQPQLIEKQLRNDLYYRLAGVEISLFSLNEQPDDILTITRNLAARMEGREVAGRIIDRAEIAKSWRYFKQGEERLKSHDWNKGNVRELNNYVRRHIFLGDDVLAELVRDQVSKSYSMPVWAAEQLSAACTTEETTLQSYLKPLNCSDDIQPLKNLTAVYTQQCWSRFMGQESQKSVAEKLGVSINTFKGILKNADTLPQTISQKNSQGQGPRKTLS